MKISVPLVLFMLLCVAQLSVPLTMIRRHEIILRDGEQVKLKCQPVDPADFFRGRYVALSFDVGEARMQAGEQAPESPVEGCATMKVDENGFARWDKASVSKAPNDRSVPYVQTSIYKLWGAEEEAIFVEMPIDRFYMEEDIAPEAERLYFEQLRKSPENTYVTARVMEGAMVLEQLYLDGVPAADYVRQQLDMPPLEQEVGAEGRPMAIDSATETVPLGSTDAK